MLNTFPELLTYSTLGPFVLRAVAGLIFIDLGLLKFKAERSRWLTSLDTLKLRPAPYILNIYAAIQIVAGIMILIGIWTQIAAVVLAVITGIELIIEWKAHEILRRDFIFYLLIFTITLSLVLTGAGAFAVDLPL